MKVIIQAVVFCFAMVGVSSAAVVQYRLTGFVSQVFVNNSSLNVPAAFPVQVNAPFSEVFSFDNSVPITSTVGSVNIYNLTSAQYASRLSVAGLNFDSQPTAVRPAVIKVIQGTGGQGTDGLSIVSDVSLPPGWTTANHAMSTMLPQFPVGTFPSALLADLPTLQRTYNGPFQGFELAFNFDFFTSSSVPGTLTYSGGASSGTNIIFTPTAILPVPEPSSLVSAVISLASLVVWFRRLARH